MTPRHRKAITLYWTQYSLSDVAHLCGLTQDRVRRVWAQAIARGEIVPIPGYERPREGFPLEILMLGPIGNQCSPERRIA